MAIPYPCPQGCPRDAGKYCARHTCQYCEETLKPEDGYKVCKTCIPDVPDPSPPLSYGYGARPKRR